MRKKVPHPQKKGHPNVRARPRKRVETYSPFLETGKFLREKRGAGTLEEEIGEREGAISMISH